MLLLICLLSLMLASPTLSEVKILSTIDGKTGPPPCAITCSGVSTETERWFHWRGKGNKYIHFEECGFVDPPVFTATMIGHTCPGVNLYGINKGVVDLLTVGDITPEELVNNRCHVFWTASGFNC